MLTHCPRCGFEQPKDQYCAQCGVDIENFLAHTKPIERPFFKSPLFFFIAFTLITGGARLGMTFLSQPSPSTTALRPKAVRPAGSFIYSSKQLIEGNTNQASSNPAADTKALNAQALLPSKPEGGTKAAAPTAKGLELANHRESSLVAKSESPQLVVYYAELSRASLENLYSLSKNTGQFLEFNDYSAGIIPQFKKLLKESKFKLLRKEFRNLDGGKPIQWFHGIKDPQDSNTEIGFQTLFEANDIENGVIKANLEIQRTWKEAVGTGGFEIQKKSFPAILEIGGGNGFFMSGIMPRQSNLESDSELVDLEIYKILNSPDFRAGDSSFVVFFEFATEN